MARGVLWVNLQILTERLRDHRGSVTPATAVSVQPSRRKPQEFRGRTAPLPGGPALAPKLSLMLTHSTHTCTRRQTDTHKYTKTQRHTYRHKYIHLQ